MDRNIRSSYVNSGSRSLPHMSSSKRHSSTSNPRLSPPMSATTPSNLPANNNNTQAGQHDDIIQYIFESWNKVTRELERGSDEAKYYQEVSAPRQLANFRPFNLDEWWGRRLVQSKKCLKHRS